MIYGMLIGIAIMFLIVPTVHAEEYEWQPVIPILDCVMEGENGTFIANWTWDNQNEENVTAIWSRFNRDTLDNSTPPMELSINATPFQTPFDEFDLVWQLRGPNKEQYVATANVNSTSCIPVITTSKGGSGIYHPDGLTDTYSYPSVDFSSANEVSYAFSVVPLRRREIFATMIPTDVFSQYCKDGTYSFCEYGIEELPEEEPTSKNEAILYLALAYILLHQTKKKK